MSGGNNNQRISTPIEALKQAQVFLREKNYHSLCDLLSSAREQWTENVPIAGMLANAYLELNEYRAAAAIFAELVEKQDTPHWIYIGYANTLERQENITGAEQYVFRALETNYSRELLIRYARLLLQLSDNDFLVKRLKTIICGLSSDTKFLAEELYFIGNFLRKNDALSCSVAFFDLAIKSDSDQPRYYRKKIFTQIRSGEITQAHRTLDCWKKNNSDNFSFNRIVSVLKQLQGIAPFITAIKNIFITEYYISEYSLLELSKEEAFNHFVTKGINEEKNPNPWFDTKYFVESFGSHIDESEPPVIAYLRMEHTGLVQPSMSFDPVFYRKHYPELANTPVVLEHYVTKGHAEGRKAVEREVPDDVIRQLDEMIGIEPKLCYAKKGLKTIVRYPTVTPSIFFVNSIRKKYTGNIKAIVCIPYIFGCYEGSVASYCIKALKEKHGSDSILVIITESLAHRRNKNKNSYSQFLDLDSECSFSSADDKVQTLHEIVGNLCPELVLNVDSHICWNLYKRYGRQLSSVISLYSYCFGYQTDLNKNRDSYVADYVSETINWLSGVIVSDNYTVKEIKDRYRFTSRNSVKIATVHTPVSDNRSFQKLRHKHKRGVLWMGGFSEQDGFQVLIKISKAMPTVNFYVYGDHTAADSNIQKHHGNVTYLGEPESFDLRDTDSYDLYLHTSKWGGIPVSIINMLSRGIPVVAANEGGINEVVNSHTGSLVRGFSDIDEYCKTINRVLFCQEDTNNKIQKGKELVNNRNNWHSFIVGLESVGLLPKSPCVVSAPKEILDMEI